MSYNSTDSNSCTKLENMIFSKISKYRKYQKCHDVFLCFLNIFFIFSIFWIFSRKWTFRISYITMYVVVTRWCTIQWLLVTSHLYHTLKLSFRWTILRYVRLMAWAVRLCLSSVTLLRPTRGLKFSAIFLHHLLAYGLRQFVLDMHESEK